MNGYTGHYLKFYFYEINLLPLPVVDQTTNNTKH